MTTIHQWRSPTTRTLAVLAIAQIIPGFACSNTRTITRPDLLPPDQGIVQARAISKLFVGREVKVNLSRPQQDGHWVPESFRTGRLAPLDGQAYLLDETGGKSYRVLFEDTHSMTSKTTGKGATRGFVFGALAGAAAGAIFGAVISGLGCSDMGSHTECPSVAEPMAGGALVGGLLVGAIGAGVGALVGYRTTVTWKMP
jgi:hypothetical protein